MLSTLLAMVLAAPAHAAAPDVTDSVVRIEVFQSRSDWTNPWRSDPGQTVSGTGFVIADGRILTNAHVVSDAHQVTVKRPDVAEPAVATIEAIGHDCDLAILRVADKNFLKGVRPLKLGEGLPLLRSQAITYGYPVGGMEVSNTAGIVSRVEFQPYFHTGTDSHLAVQTDAALNPGNSGGPVIQDGKVVGVAFQILPTKQSIGYFIPIPVIRHFLTDVKDGHYDGFPDLGASTLRMVSRALRRERGVPADKSGVVVQEVARDGTADGVLQPGDVLMSVDGVAVADDGRVSVGTHHVSFHYLFDQKQLGEPVRLKVWRQGKEVELTAKSRRIPYADEARVAYDVKPRYLLYGGMLFMPLNLTLLGALESKQLLKWSAEVRSDLLWNLFFRSRELPATSGKEVVLMVHLYRHAVNSQMAWWGPIPVKRVNGKDIQSLKNLSDTLAANHGPFQTFEYEPIDGIEALDRVKAEAAQKEILDQYGIPSDRNL
jgi:S1-C subfamily serine protease